MTNNVMQNIQELNDKRSRREILSECLLELKLSKNSAWQFIMGISAALVLSIYITFFSNTIEAARITASTFLDVQLAFFAVIFGAYAIFQALMRDEIIKELIRTENNILKDSNRTFLNLSILYIFDIFITVIISIVVNICPEDIYIYSIWISHILFLIVSFVYFTLNFLLMLENINFVINLYRMFNVYNIYRALDAFDDDQTD